MKPFVAASYELIPNRWVDTHTQWSDPMCRQEIAACLDLAWTMSVFRLSAGPFFCACFCLTTAEQCCLPFSPLEFGLIYFFDLWYFSIERVCFHHNLLCLATWRFFTCGLYIISKSRIPLSGFTSIGSCCRIPEKAFKALTIFSKITRILPKHVGHAPWYWCTSGPSTPPLYLKVRTILC